MDINKNFWASFLNSIELSNSLYPDSLPNNEYFHIFIKNLPRFLHYEIYYKRGDWIVALHCESAEYRKIFYEYFLCLYYNFKTNRILYYNTSSDFLGLEIVCKNLEYVNINFYILVDYTLDKIKRIYYEHEILKDKSIKVVMLNWGIGNVLFQYLLGISLSLNFNCKVLYHLCEFKNNVVNNNIDNISRIKFQQLNLASSDEVKLCQQSNFVKQHSFCNYMENIFFNNYDYAYYWGCWHNLDYFKRIDNVNNYIEIKEIDEKDDNINILEKIKNSNSVFIHFRRGDYGKNIMLNENYYIDAINYIQAHVVDPVFFIFGIVIEGFLDKLKKINYVYIGYNNNKNNKDTVDLYLMSQCKHAIVANSTFSFFGAFLNSCPNRIVCAPYPWMASGCKDELIPKNWVKINLR